MLLALVVVAAIVVGLVAYAILMAAEMPTARRRPVYSGVREQRSAPRRDDSSPRRRETLEQIANTRRQDALAKDAEKRIRIDLLGRGFTLDVVGPSFQQESFRRLDGGRLAGGVTVAFTALIVPDPGNPFSKSGPALMVAAEGYGPIGYFPEDEAKRYRGLLEMLLAIGAVGACPGWLVGSYGKEPRIGARLSIMSPEEVLGTMQERPGTGTSRVAGGAAGGEPTAAERNEVPAREVARSSSRRFRER